MKMFYLYKIVNSVNSKVYIGITSQPTKRKNRHFSSKGHSSLSLVRQAMNKYGKDRFSFEIMCIGSKDYILDLEVKAISAYKTQQKEFGYNIKPGGESGRGYSLEKSWSIKPVFVSGFWFPSRRIAIGSLNITINIYKNRQRMGTLQNVIQPTQKEIPRYIAGFWFPSLNKASEVLAIGYSTLNARLQRGFLEANKASRNQSGKNNHMFGIPPEKHPNSISVIISGVLYSSLKEAVDGTGLSKYIINKRIKENHKDFKYLEEI